MSNPYLQPQAQTQQPVVVQQSGPPWVLIILLIVGGFLVYDKSQHGDWFWERGDHQEQNDDRKDDQDQQDDKQDEDQQDDQQDEQNDGIDFNNATLVIVVDSETTASQQDIVDAMRPLEGKGLWEKYGFAEYRKWDDDQPAAQLYLDSQQAPAVYITLNGGVVKSAPLPDSVSKLEEVIKSWQK